MATRRLLMSPSPGRHGGYGSRRPASNGKRLLGRHRPRACLDGVGGALVGWRTSGWARLSRIMDRDARRREDLAKGGEVDRGASLVSGEDHLAAADVLGLYVRVAHGGQQPDEPRSR